MSLDKDLKIPPSSSGKSVTRDMIDRLEARVPIPRTPEPPLASKSESPLKFQLAMGDLDKKFKLIEEENKKLREEFQRKLEEIGEKNSEGAPNMKVGSEDAAKNAVDALQDIVRRFNDDMEEWYEKTGCDAIFSWKYDPKKKIEVASVDLVVYRKSAPSALTIKEALEAGEDKK